MVGYKVTLINNLAHPFKIKGQQMLFALHALRQKFACGPSRSSRVTTVWLQIQRVASLKLRQNLIRNAGLAIKTLGIQYLSRHTVSLLVFSGNRNNRNAFGGSTLCQLPCSRKTVRPWHVAIHHDDVRLAGFGLGHAVCASGGHCEHMASMHQNILRVLNIDG